MEFLVEILKEAGPWLANFVLNLQAIVLQARGGQLTLIVSLWIVLILGVPFLRGRAAIPLRILAGLALSLLGLSFDAIRLGLLFAADAKSVANGLLIGLLISAALAGFVFFNKKKGV